MKEDKYTKTLAKNQVCEIFQMRDIGKNGLPKFIKLCMETSCWCPFQEHQYGSFENEALENKDRSTKHPNLENEDP